MLYTVGEIAKKMDVAPSTLRYYDKEGLLPFVERSNGGIRMFKEVDIQTLSIIECLKKTGLSIKGIKLFMDWCMEGDATIDRRLELMKQQRAVVQEQIAKMQDTLALLDYKCWYYQTAKDAGTCKIHENMVDSEIPQQYRTAKQKAQKLE